MKELLTKTFWTGVKKTYDDALKGPPPEEKTLPPAAEPTPDSHPERPEATGVIPPAASERLNAGTSLSINWRYSAFAAARSFSIMSVRLNAVSVGL